MQKDGEQTVNSRLENGTMVFSSKENVRESVHQWLKDGEIDEIWEESAISTVKQNGRFFTLKQTALKESEIPCALTKK